MVRPVTEPGTGYGTSTRFHWWFRSGPNFNPQHFILRNFISQNFTLCHLTLRHFIPRQFLSHDNFIPGQFYPATLYPAKLYPAKLYPGTLYPVARVLHGPPTGGGGMPPPPLKIYGQGSTLINFEGVEKTGFRDNGDQEGSLCWWIHSVGGFFEAIHPSNRHQHSGQAQNWNPSIIL